MALHLINDESSQMDLRNSSPVTASSDEGLSSAPSRNNLSSWQDIRQAVRSSRKFQSQLANKIPHNFSFVPLSISDNDSQDINIYTEGSRVLFLGVMQGQRENTLLYVDVPAKHSPALLDKPVEWKQALGCFQGVCIDKYSKEEELLRERKRLSVHGITTYQVSSDNSRILFPASGSLFVMNLKHIGMVDLCEPEEIFTSCLGSRMDPKMSPCDADLVSFVHENDVWVTHTRSHVELRLTHVAKGTKTIENPLSAGVASYVVQEEFDRYTGYWWQPNNPSGKHCILYELVDESSVDILNISNPLAQPDIDSFRYPKAGTSNAKVSLRMVEFSTTSDGEIYDVVTKKMSESLQLLFPWMEYIVRIDWLPNGKGIWAQLLDRLQQRTAVVFVPYSNFDRVVCDSVDFMDDCVRRSNGTDVEMSAVDEAVPLSSTSLSSSFQNGVKILYEETSQIWINVHDAFYFFKNNSEDEVNFIWASEQTGHRHLYLIKANLKRFNRSKRHSTGDLVTGESRYCFTTCTVVTSGEWEVMEQSDSIWVDEEKEQVYFMALKDTPLESHLYKTSYTNPGNITKLTHSGFSHSVAMSKNCDLFVTVSSSINELYTAKIYYLSPWPVALVNVLEPLAMSPEYATPELFTFNGSSGDLMHGLFMKPSNTEPGKKYPTVLYVYGGPHVQLVTNSFKGLRYQRLYTLVALGYVVIAIDGHGSTHRGLRFEGNLKHRMGQVEIADQVKGLLHLASEVDFIDLTRVALHGWSYGGYLSLMGLSQRPDIFKVAVAGAPVVSWEQYDTAYTERYMGTPQSNPDGYREGSVLARVPHFPNEPNRLLIVHGLIDENVHFVHTALLVQALVKNCKPYQLQIYPGERHGIRSPDSNEHFEVAVVSFLQQNL